MTGQATVTCTSCDSPTIPVVYQVLRSAWDGTAIDGGRSYLVGQLNVAQVPENGSVALPVSLLDHVDPGRNVYQIQVSADYTTGTADLGSVTINAVDLGRQ